MFQAACQINGNFAGSKEFSIIATGENGLPLVVALQDVDGGRVIFDCFRERLFDSTRILQSARYLKNGAAWLAFSEKAKTDLALMGLTEPETSSSSFFVGLPTLVIIAMTIAGFAYYKKVFSKKQQRDLEARLTASYV
jgi:hypothetical protein